MSYLWPCLENIRALANVPAMWGCWLGNDFEAVERAFLERSPTPAMSYPCAQQCGCAHRLVARTEGSYVGVCTCDPWNCDDFVVPQAEAAVLELNWSRLGRAICKALDCDYRETAMPLPFTRQIGCKFANAVPVLLTIQSEREEFRQAVAGVIARLGRSFILLGPTTRWLDADTLGLLHSARSEFFDLESQLTMLPTGAFQAHKTGGELFAKFLPEGEETAGQREVSRVFALMKMLGSGAKKAPLDAVFRLLVLEGRNQDYAAKEFQCSKALLSLRVEEIEKRMKKTLSELRALASHLGEMAATVQNRRTGYRQVVADDPAEKEDEEGTF